jgi:Holliday junction resolvasome RuvABC DNA-binding subunit
MAERIALELRDKALGVRGDLEAPPAKIVTDEDKKVFDDALSALLNLGYPAKSAKRAAEKALNSAERFSLENLIKEALRLLAG